MTTPIPFMDLHRQYESIKHEVHAAFDRVCRSTAFAGGPFVEEFETHFAAFCKAGHAVAVNSGTSALHCAMLALDIGPGDEVIVPANTFIATAWAPAYVGAVPVFADCTEDTWNIDPSKLERHISKKTRAIIGVHLYGQPFDIDAVGAVARKHGLYLVEDCAQAHGALYKNAPVGTFGEMGCFSFYPGKNLGAYGEGGAVVTNNETFARRIQALRNHASTVRYYHDEIGYNMRMDGIQAAILSVKLDHLPDWNNRRRQIASKYLRGISNSYITLQRQPSWAQSVFHLLVALADDRKKIMKYMAEKGIDTAIHYPVPCHQQKAFGKAGITPASLPRAQYQTAHCLSLPMFPELTDEEVGLVIEAVNSFVPG
jgi:dTDP-4-amino-4,6-dideoxygalactose transaminase